jgi:large subunit ribosomal protein L23
MYKSILLKPRLSEKSYGLSQLTRTYIFEVPTNVNKQTVAHAVEEQYEVVVSNVNVANFLGKAKRTVRKGGKAVKGREADYKKAYVTLAEGHVLPIFAVEEEADAKAAKAEEKAAKKDKKSAKETSKESK